MIRDDELVLRSHGAEVRAEKTFIPDSSNGTVTIDFIIDSTSIAGRTVTAFEELKYNGILLAVHADINDEGQSVDFPKVWTTAKDVETGNHLGHLSETTEIQDEVFYTNLIPGKEYTVSGLLMVRSEGTALIQNEHEIRAEKTFIPEDRSGSVILSFTVDSTLLCGQTIVAFEDLIYNGVVIASHADIEDEEQSVHFPAAHTQACDEKKGGNVLTFGEGTVVIDTVLYENLIPGQTYTVKGVLMDRETGEATEITGEAEFVPETENGEADVRFTLDVTAEMMNKSFVVFEEIYDENGILVAEHKDINDEAQTVNVVIGTADVPKPNPRRSETPILGIEKNFTVVFIVLAASILLTLGAAVLIRKKRG